MLDTITGSCGIAIVVMVVVVVVAVRASSFGD